MKYIVYCHTLNAKKYVGYTKKTMLERLADHIEEAEDGSDRHFCRAIRKYGADNIVSELLCEVSSKQEATRKERYYIKKFNTFESGYNMTRGGDGGNTTEKYSDEEMKELVSLRSSLQSGMNNSRAKPSITAEMIIDAVVEYVKQNNKAGEYILRKEIESTLQNVLDISSIMIRSRVKSLSNLIQEVNVRLVAEKLSEVKYDSHYRSPEQKALASAATKTQRWVTDGTVNVKVNEHELDKFLSENKNYKRGRTL